MNRIVRIGGAGGFLGDSQIAAPQLLAAGKLDYIVLDYLAEVTMSLLARSQAKTPGGGYARDFTEWVWKDNLAALKAQGVKLVTNAGGLNPAACRARMEALAAEAGLSFKIAIIEGDDLRPRRDEISGAPEMFTGAEAPDPSRTLSLNAYLGAKPIAEALDAGAEVVITGRVVDSAVVLGPLVHEFGWAWDDYDRLAAGSLCGHVLECGAQATGGLFTDWEKVPDWAHIGYPIAECAPDGSFIVTKPEGTGGLCAPATIAEQILYEVGDPQSYPLPDVICDFTQVTVEDAGPNRVRVAGAKGRAPSGAYKVCQTYQDGWRVIALSPVVGRDAARKAERQASAVIERVEELLRARNLPPFRATRIEALGAEATYGAQSRARDSREVICKIGVEHEDRAAIEVLLREIESPTTSMSVGSTGWFGARPTPAPVVRIHSFLIDRDRAPARVDVDGRAFASDLAPVTPGPAPEPIAPGPTERPPLAELAMVPLVALAWGRSGDKGDAFNVGVIARRPEFMPYIRAALTEDAVKQWFAHEFEGATAPQVRRYEVPGLDALNFHLLQSLGGGQMASLRLDALAKGKAQQLLDMEIAVPAALLPGIEAAA
jgi:hypothetical protein